MILKHRYLFPTSILLSSATGLGVSLIIGTEEKLETNKTTENIDSNISEENQEREEQLQKLEPEVTEAAEENEEAKTSPEVTEPVETPSNEKQEEELNDEDKYEDGTPIVSYMSGNRLKTVEEIKRDIKRAKDDNAFAVKTGALSYTEGIKIFNAEEQQKAKSEFEKYNPLNSSTADKWKLIDYDDHASWRYKTVDFMRSDTKSPMDWLNEIESEEIDIDAESGKEKLASKLRERCYEAADYISDKEKLKEKFGNAAYPDFDGTEVINLCTFINTEA